MERKTHLFTVKKENKKEKHRSNGVKILLQFHRV